MSFGSVFHGKEDVSRPDHAWEMGKLLPIWCNWKGMGGSFAMVVPQERQEQQPDCAKQSR